MMSEICMKAKILREKLKRDPESAPEVFKSIESLESEMILCVSKFESFL
jgi:hypothetical protein